MKEKIKEAIIETGIGIILMVTSPIMVGKMIVGKIKGNRPKVEVKEISVDYNKLDKKTQKNIMRLYSKKNGIPCE